MTVEKKLKILIKLSSTIIIWLIPILIEDRYEKRKSGQQGKNQLCIHTLEILLNMYKYSWHIPKFPEIFL